MSLALARARVRGRVVAVAALGARCPGVDLERVAFGGLALRILIEPREVDIGGALPLLFNVDEFGRFCVVSARLLAEKSSY